MEENENSTALYDSQFFKINFNEIIRTINPKKMVKVSEVGFSNFMNKQDEV